MVSKASLVREMRLDKRLTQEDVAKVMKISQATYSLIEVGKKPRGTEDALKAISRMRKRTDGTVGGSKKAGRRRP